MNCIVPFLFLLTDSYFHCECVVNWFFFLSSSRLLIDVKNTDERCQSTRVKWAWQFKYIELSSAIYWIFVVSHERVASSINFKSTFNVNHYHIYANFCTMQFGSRLFTSVTSCHLIINFFRHFFRAFFARFHWIERDDKKTL